MAEKNAEKTVALSASQSRAIRGAIDVKIAQIKRQMSKTADEPELLELLEQKIKFLEGCQAAVRF